MSAPAAHGAGAREASGHARTANAPAASLSALRKSFGAREILRGVELVAPSERVTVVLGPSGCGKSTLLRILLGLESYDAGSARLLGREVQGLSRAQSRALMLEIGVLFQFGALFDSMTVNENIGFALRHVRRAPEDEIAVRCEENLRRVGLPKIGALRPPELSGGMRKRVALARAIAHGPRLLFVDEPTTGLDPLSARSIHELILELNRELGMTIFCITHDIHAAFGLADHMAMLHEGRVIASGSADEMSASEIPEVRRFLGAVR